MKISAYRYSMFVNVKGGNVWQRLATTGKVSLGKVACLCQAATDDLINGRIDVGDAVKSFKTKFLMPKAVNNNVVNGVSEKPGNNIVICQTKLGAVVANKPSDKNHQVRIRSKCGTPHDEDPFRTRFQWIAYNVDTKEFSGTGSGNPQSLLVLERVNWVRS